MTLLFNTTKILENSSLQGFIQFCSEPNSFEVNSSNIQKCKICKCPLFQLTDKNEYDCPICHPNSPFSEKTYKYPEKMKSRNHFFFIFDISMPPKSLYAYLQALYNSLYDENTISILCLANNAIFASVVNDLLVFDIYENMNNIKPLKYYTITRSQIQSVVLPSITSVYALTPEELKETADPFFALRCAIKAAEKTPVSYMLFFYRNVTHLQVSEAEDLGKLVSSSNSIVHFGGPPQFRRFTSVARFSFGAVFVTENMKSSVIAHLVSLSRINNRLRVYAPKSIRFTKSTRDGSFVSKDLLTVLKLGFTIGLSIRYEVDVENVKSSNIKLVESTRTENGTFMKIHTLYKENGEIDSSVSDTIILKEFSSNVLRLIWDGEDFKKTIIEKISKEICEIIKGTCMDNIGNNMQIDILRLYYIRLLFGKCNLSSSYEETDDCKYIIAPPIIYVLKKKDEFSMPEFDQYLYPFFISVVTEEEFENLQIKYNV